MKEILLFCYFILLTSLKLIQNKNKGPVKQKPIELPQPILLPTLSPSLSPTLLTLFPSIDYTLLPIPSSSSSSSPLSSSPPTSLSSPSPSSPPLESQIPTYSSSSLSSSQPISLQSQNPSTFNTIILSTHPTIISTIQSNLPSSVTQVTNVPSQIPSLSTEISFPPINSSFISLNCSSPTLQPSCMSTFPTIEPQYPSTLPSLLPTQLPSSCSEFPYPTTIISSQYPSILPSIISTSSSDNPSLIPSISPSIIPSETSLYPSPTLSPSLTPSFFTLQPSSFLTSSPISSSNPSISPTFYLSDYPTQTNSLIPTLSSQYPSIFPSYSIKPSFISTLSINPSLSPQTFTPSQIPSFSFSPITSIPQSNLPTFSPILSSQLPTYSPLLLPSRLPSNSPTTSNLQVPSSSPTHLNYPSLFPSHSSSTLPSLFPSSSSSPSFLPSPSPSSPSLSQLPSYSPSTSLTHSNSNSPSFFYSPSLLPSSPPLSQSPTKFPSIIPSILSTIQPSISHQFSSSNFFSIVYVGNTSLVSLETTNTLSQLGLSLSEIFLIIVNEENIEMKLKSYNVTILSSNIPLDSFNKFPIWKLYFNYDLEWPILVNSTTIIDTKKSLTIQLNKSVWSGEVQSLFRLTIRGITVCPEDNFSLCYFSIPNSNNPSSSKTFYCDKHRTKNFWHYFFFNIGNTLTSLIIFILINIILALRTFILCWQYTNNLINFYQSQFQNQLDNLFTFTQKSIITFLLLLIIIIIVLRLTVDGLNINQVTRSEVYNNQFFLCSEYSIRYLQDYYKISSRSKYILTFIAISQNLNSFFYLQIAIGIQILLKKINTDNQLNNKIYKYFLDLIMFILIVMFTFGYVITICILFPSQYLLLSTKKGKLWIGQITCGIFLFLYSLFSLYSLSNNFHTNQFSSLFEANLSPNEWIHRRRRNYTRICNQEQLIFIPENNQPQELQELQELHNSRNTLSSLTHSYENNHELLDISNHEENQVSSLTSNNSLSILNRRRNYLTIFYLVTLIKSFLLIIVGNKISLINPFVAFILQSICGRLIDVIMIYILLNLLRNIINEKERQRFYQEISLDQENDENHGDIEENESRESFSSFSTFDHLDNSVIIESETLESLPIPNIIRSQQSFEYNLDDLRAPRVNSNQERLNIPQINIPHNINNNNNNIKKKKWDNKELIKKRDPKDILDDLLTI